MSQQPQQTLGKLIGVGVGPGASDLLTLRAVRVLNSVQVIAIPRPNAYASSLAWRLASPHVEARESQEKLFLTFPMTKDAWQLHAAWDEAASAIASRLVVGHDVAFITQGDAMVYSTFIYLREALLSRLPGLLVEIVPGVSSLSAVPAALGIPLADGQERVAVIPATYGVEDLRRILREFDSVLLLKVASKIKEVISALEAEGLLEHATYIERATSDEQRIEHDLRRMRDDRCVYFSMVLVKKPTAPGGLRAAREARV